MQLTGHRLQTYPEAYLSAFGVSQKTLPQIIDACLRSPKTQQGYASLYRTIETETARFSVRSKGCGFDQGGIIKKAIPYSFEVSAPGFWWRMRVKQGPAANKPAQCAVVSPYITGRYYGDDIALILTGADRLPSLLPGDDVRAEMSMAAESLRPIAAGPGADLRATPRMEPDPGRPSEEDLSGGLGLAKVTGRIETVRTCPPAKKNNEGIELDETLLLHAQTV